MDDSVRQFLEQVPGNAPRSKLEPYRDVIRELRKKRCTYKQVAQFFAERLGISVAPSTIHAFVAVRARRNRRPVYEIPADDIATASPERPAANDKTVDPSDPIEALKRRRPPEPPKRHRFEFTEGEVLTLTGERKDIAE